jgi:hypothetical protein
MQGIQPFLGGAIIYTAGFISLQSDWVRTTGYTYRTASGLHWKVGGIFVIAFFFALAGVAGLSTCG